MAVNKVVYGGETVIDLTNDSVTPETLALGVTAHDKSGNAIVGTMVAGSGSGGSVETCTVNIVQEWGGNDDPALCRVMVCAYDIQTNSVVREHMTSEEDFLPSHSITFKAYRDYPIVVIVYSITHAFSATTVVSGGSILDSQEGFYNDGSIFYWCMPTSDNATFTFASP